MAPMRSQEPVQGLGLLVCVAAVLLVPSRAPAQAPSIEEAEALMAAGRYRDVRERAAAALKGSPPAREAAIWKLVIAESFYMEGDLEEASKSYKELAHDAPAPLGTEAMLKAAKCHLRMWDTEGAQEALKSLSSVEEPGLTVERDELAAIATFLSGKQDEARKGFEALPRKSGAGWHYLGLVAFNGGEFQKAVEYFQKAIAEEPDDYYNYLYKASSLLELGRLDDARAAFKDVAKIAETPEVSQLMGRLELRAERFQEAEARFRKALAAAPGHAEAQFGLATTLRRLGKTKEAQEAFKKFQELHQAQQDSLKRAYVLDQKRAANPKDPGPAEELALHYFANNDPSAAERTSWLALRADPRRIVPRLCLARTLVSVGRYREASVHYQRILRQDPGQTAAQSEFRALVEQHARRADAPGR